MKETLEMAGLTIAVLLIVMTAALIFVLGLVFLADLIVNERRAQLKRDEPTVPVPWVQPKLFDQDAEEGWEG